MNAFGKRAAAGLVLTLGLLLDGSGNAAPVSLEWKDLIPTAAQASQGVVKGVVAHEDIAALQTAEGEAAEEQANAPVRTDLDGQDVRMAGYVVPMAIKGTAVVEFLLVPFVGACIHVPAPPANQIVYIVYPKGVDLGELTDAVWVTGKMKATLTSTDLAAVGYRIDAGGVEAASF